MLYQVEIIEKKKNKKLIIVYIIVLLLALVASIILGIFVAKKANNNKHELNNVENIVEQNNNLDKNDITLKEKESFISKVNNIYNGTEGKRAFLTFDDGPSKEVTPHILEILKKYNIKATFFVIGNRVSNNKELIQMEYNQGHYIANHGYSHQYSKIYKSSNEVLKEYNKTEQKIKEALENDNYSSNLFRFPGGSVGGAYDDIKQKTIKELEKNNIAYLDWNALTNDSAGADTKEKIMSNLKKTVKNKNNVVILMHDAPDKILTYETLEDIIKYLQEKGYAFKNMYDLINAEE